MKKDRIRLTKLDALLKDKKLSQADLAQMVNSTAPYISQVICGDRTASLSLCLKIIEVLPDEISLEDLRPELISKAALELEANHG